MTLRRIGPAEPPDLDWVLVANAARARCFERDPENDALRELAAFVHPASRMKGHELDADRGGLVHKGVASTQYAPRQDVHEKEAERFARELASFVETEVLAHRCRRLHLVASSPFLGVLRSSLGPAATARLGQCAAVDFSAYQDRELEQRIAGALTPESR